DVHLTAAGLVFAALHATKAEAALRELAPVLEFGYTLPRAVDNGNAVQALEPALSEQVEAAFLVSQERALDPSALIDGLVARLRALGVSIRSGCAVRDLEVEGGRVIALRT